MNHDFSTGQKAFEVALVLEKEVNKALLELVNVAVANKDAQVEWRFVLLCVDFVIPSIDSFDDKSNSGQKKSMAKWFRALNSVVKSSEHGSNPGHDTCVLERDAEINCFSSSRGV